MCGFNDAERIPDAGKYDMRRSPRHGNPQYGELTKRPLKLQDTAKFHGRARNIQMEGRTRREAARRVAA